MQLFADLYDELTGFPKPTVAACHGACVGGGAEIAVACDLRVGGSNLRLRFPGGGARRARRPGPAGHALRPLGRQVPAADGRRRSTPTMAHRWGLVHKVAPAAAHRGAPPCSSPRRSPTNPPEAVARLKRMLHEWDGVEDRSRVEGEGQVEWQRSGPGPAVRGTMSLRPLLRIAAEDERVAALAESIGTGEATAARASASIRPYLLAALLDAADALAGRPALVVAADDIAARDLARDLGAYLAPRRVHHYPSRGTGYESHLTPAPHLVGLRIAALDALTGWRRNGRAAGGRRERGRARRGGYPTPRCGRRRFAISVGEEVDLADVAELLVELGYERADQVDERGQFAVRGGILDVYAATEDRAARIELFGDEVESIRWFSTFTQRSLGDAERLELAPAAELALEHRELAEIAVAEEREGGEPADLAAGPPDRPLRRALRPDPRETAVLIAAADEIPGALRDHWEDVTTAMHDDDARRLYVDVAGPLAERAVAASCTAARRRADETGSAARRFRGADAHLGGAVDLARPSRSSRRSSAPGYVVVGRLREPGRGGARAVQPRPRRRRGSSTRARAGRARRLLAEAQLTDGFVSPDLHLAVIPFRRLVHRRRAAAPAPARGPPRLRLRPARRRPRRPRRPRHRPLRRLRDEDGRRGHPRLPRARVPRRRQGLRADRPARQDHPLRRRRRRRAAALGARVASAGRRSRRGPAAPRASSPASCSTSTPSARRAAATPSRPTASGSSSSSASFPYRETADQIEAIEAVKADMESARPMDRLICGDVGYGKTEVALRAAHKAVADGKQVMMLVPTTILAQQHLGTFRERFADFPVEIEMVSRLRKPAEVRDALARFADGKVDILIGTHRLLSRDVRAPRTSGLVIVDEEQRFGVKQKELLRQLKLQGRRALAVGDADPADAADEPRRAARHLGDRDAAGGPAPGPHLRRPLRRGARRAARSSARSAREGQVFFLHNRIETLHETAERLRALCPGVRFAEAHGQMDEGELEATMLALPARRRRLPGRDDDHRVGPRHPAGQHADRRARRPPRARAGLPDPRPGRAALASAPSPTCSTPPRRR